MQNQHFVFLIKGDTVVPQSLSDPAVGEIIRSTLLEKFHISKLHIIAADNKEALEKFAMLSESYPDKKLEEVIIC
ncbi:MULTISPECIES: hypothetical protein [Pantoea]|uniref:Uncharacterized protein n=1 Tax=Candidatus Pantoea multigeneris TaxID=2608357 RepID=A0ABX0R8X9_9GAMM|nr:MULTISPECIES: hypothetical protein [Pantoea]NIF20771.1 hypothetical protein [Pantoea multigeneris]